MRKTLLTVLLAAASMVVGCQSTKSQNAGVVAEIPVNNFRAEWTRQLQMSGRPRDMYVRGDNLFIYSTNNLLFRMDRKSGDVRFISNIAPRGTKVGAPAIIGDHLAIPSDTSLFIVDDRGFRDRTIELGQPIRSGIVANETGIFCGLDAGRSGGRVAAIDLDRPYSPFRWQLMTQGTVIATPALLGGNLYAAGDDGIVYAADPDRGAIWAEIGTTFRTQGPVHADVKADASGVYVASADSKLYCLSPESGRIKWQYFSGTPLFDTPALTQSSVYILVRDRGVTAISTGDGAFNRSPRWSVRESVEFLAEGEDLVFLRGRDRSILAVDKQSGEIRFKSQRKDLVAFAVNELDNLVYAATSGGRVYAIVAVTRPGAVGELVMADPSEVTSAAN